MKVVIDITEQDYQLACKYPDVLISVYAHAIKKGTPLPKGHGRLIDADELKKHKYHDSNRFENAVSVAYIDWADTIIEADKGETE